MTYIERNRCDRKQSKDLTFLTQLACVDQTPLLEQQISVQAVKIYLLGKQLSFVNTPLSLC